MGITVHCMAGFVDSLGCGVVSLPTLFIFQFNPLCTLHVPDSGDFSTGCILMQNLCLLGSVLHITNNLHPLVATPDTVNKNKQTKHLHPLLLEGRPCVGKSDNIKSLFIPAHQRERWVAPHLLKPSITHSKSYVVRNDDAILYNSDVNIRAPS